MYNMYSIFIYVSRKFSKCWLCFHRNMYVLSTKFKIWSFANGRITWSNMTVGISQYISSDCHPELQSQMHSSLEDISVPQKFNHFQIYLWLPPYLSALRLIFSISFNGFSSNWIQWFIWTSHAFILSIRIDLQIFSIYSNCASHTYSFLSSLMPWLKAWPHHPMWAIILQ